MSKLTLSQVVELAKEKTNYLFNDRTQIRLTADEVSYMLYRIDGKYYIGVSMQEPVQPQFPIFKNRSVLDFQSNLDQRIIAKVQFLMSVK